MEEIVALFRELPFADYDFNSNGDEELIITKRSNSIPSSDSTGGGGDKSKEGGEEDTDGGGKEVFKPEPLIVGPPCVTLSSPTPLEG